MSNKESSAARQTAELPAWISYWSPPPFPPPFFFSSPAVDPSRVTCVINSVCSKQSRTPRLHQAAAALISGQLVILSKRVVLLSASIIATAFLLCQDKGNCSYKHIFCSIWFSNSRWTRVLAMRICDFFFFSIMSWFTNCGRTWVDAEQLRQLRQMHVGQPRLV